MIFWTLAFPLLLATLFNLAFANLSEIDTFLKIPVAVVDDNAYRQNTSLQMALNATAMDSADSGLLDLTLTDDVTARQLLADGQVDGIISQDPQLHLVVKSSGLNQTILKSFLDDYSQTVQALADIATGNPQVQFESLLSVVEDRRDYIAALPISKDMLNSTVIYFYSLIAMTALYGGFWGMRIVNENQANLSAQGARVSVAPVHKLLRLMVDIGAALVIQNLIVLIVITYIRLVLGYSFGNQLSWILLASLVACFTGIAFGSCIGAAVKTGEGVKTGILIGSTMIMSLFSGMMYHGIKYIVTRAMPIMAYINPANLITDAFLALYYDGASASYFTNLLILLAFGLMFSLLTFAVLRRQRYASL